MWWPGDGGLMNTGVLFRFVQMSTLKTDFLKVWVSSTSITVLGHGWVPVHTAPSFIPPIVIFPVRLYQFCFYIFVCANAAATALETRATACFHSARRLGSHVHTAKLTEAVHFALTHTAACKHNTGSSIDSWCPAETQQLRMSLLSLWP